MIETKAFAFSDFSPLVGSSFHVNSDSSRSLPLELVEAAKLGKNSLGQNSKTEAFSLLFKGPNDSVLPQKIYSLIHSQLGELNIFLVPVGQDAEGIRYEAVFN
ncbi:MAG: hypothetical protein AAGD25_30870 [Cyanobacteria bacterium P01_F01_bin.150]